MSNMKTLAEVKADMSELYDQVREGGCDLKLAAELANITGKFLKAEQLIFAREIFLVNQPQYKVITDGTEQREQARI